MLCSLASGRGVTRGDGPPRLRDRPGVAGMEEFAELPCRPLLLRGSDLLAHQLVVEGPLDIAEDADRGRALWRVRDPRECEREARGLVVLVVDEQRVLAHLGDLDQLA